MTDQIILEKEPIDPELPPEFFDGLLHLADPTDAGTVNPVDPDRPPVDGVLGGGSALYIGKGLKSAEFAAYVQTYNFGSQPPTFVVLHHTSIPDTMHARVRHGSWDAGETGMDEAQIYAKRQRQLTGIWNYYQQQLGWDRGPHLFIDDRWIWLFTPMYYQGIHAAEGNGMPHSYSIGIEVIGHYEWVQWPQPIEDLVGYSVAVLKQRLGTFELKHQPFAGGVSSHRDYNKPACPGGAITEAYYLNVLHCAWQRVSSGEMHTSSTDDASAAISLDMPILGAASGLQQQAVAYIRSRLPVTSEYINDVELIMGYYWTYAPTVGVDPFLAAGQCIFETDALRSPWAARPRRNPAGLGVRQEGGLMFASWDLAVQAHIGQLLAFALREEEADDAQRQMMRSNPRHLHIGPEMRGSAKTLADLNNRWTDDADYAGKMVVRLQDIQRG